MVMMEVLSAATIVQRFAELYPNSVDAVQIVEHIRPVISVRTPQ